MCCSFSLFVFWSLSLLDSDSDSELSVDEHSSSYASSHSSDSEDDDMDIKPKWNNERQPLHSTPKGPSIAPKVEAVSNHVKPHCPKEAMTASDSEDPGGAERLRVETKVNVELHQENKLNHVGERGETPQDRETPTRENGPLSLPSNGPPSLGTHQPEPKKGILKNKITYPPPLTDKNMKNRLREKLSDYNPPPIIPPSKTPSVASDDGVSPVSVGNSNSAIIKPPIAPRPQLPQNGGVAMSMKAMTTNGGNESDSDGSNETSI
uniref:Uncharacterized protein n=1 Tax=Hucho hucho TaxID=62062 RepID=A0A4W5R940_9TELE